MTIDQVRAKTADLASRLDRFTPLTVYETAFRDELTSWAKVAAVLCDEIDRLRAENATLRGKLDGRPDRHGQGEGGVGGAGAAAEGGAAAVPGD